MDVDRIVETLKKKYLGKVVIVTDLQNPGEIICETEPTSEHPDWSEAIAVIDFTRLHYHKTLTETYEIVEGELTMYFNGEPQYLKKGDKIKLPPGTTHRAEGKETWVRVIARPGWTPEDHILVVDGQEISRKQYDKGTW